MHPRLLIVDDDPEIASALVRGLALHGYDAQAEQRADRALEALHSTEFSGAVIDVMLGADSGLDLVRAARQAGMTLPIIMLSALSEVDDRTQGLEAGADDYIVKPFSFDELVARLRVQEHRARARVPTEAIMRDANRTVTGATGQITLTEREYMLLAHLARTPGTPQPRGAIFDTLWVQDGSVNENVVDVYIGYLRKKLASADLGFEIKTIRNKGFCIDGIAPKRETQ